MRSKTLCSVQPWDFFTLQALTCTLLLNRIWWDPGNFCLFPRELLRWTWASMGEAAIWRLIWFIQLLNEECRLLICENAALGWLQKYRAVPRRRMDLNLYKARNCELFIRATTATQETADRGCHNHYDVNMLITNACTIVIAFSEDGKKCIRQCQNNCNVFSPFTHKSCGNRDSCNYPKFNFSRVVFSSWGAGLATSAERPTRGSTFTQHVVYVCKFESAETFCERVSWKLLGSEMFLAELLSYVLFVYVNKTSSYRQRNDFSNCD